MLGPMEYSNGQSWRNEVKEKLKSVGILFFDTYYKPFLNRKEENDKVRQKWFKWMSLGKFDKVSFELKTVRSDDLRLCDLSDFGIVQIRPSVPTYGTMEELSWLNRCKKPLFIFIEGGKKKTPIWLMGMIPHKYIYNNLDEIISMLLKIDSGEKKIDSDRWRLLRKECR